MSPSVISYQVVTCEPEQVFDVMLNSAGSAKLAVVKEVKNLLGLGLKEAKELVDGAPGAIKTGIPKEEAVKVGLPEKDYIPETLEEKIVAHADNLIQDGNKQKIEDGLKYQQKLRDEW